ncbi:GNAT family N-acetyltransferase [Candidatus Enterococcus murrayae]|uniref:GNAT family N-acetyltransferase n=1 Tax=Candidatus Enterococcus murrayae TaxID=2815321 RepID=A0ABS3HK99_9ENTE|nr:GNAT family N-acetyltransferase [Enterococcus sp. MJM16]
MGYEDEDFIVRQAKQMGELLGGILGKKEAEAILSFGDEAAISESNEQVVDFRPSTLSDLPAIGLIIDEAKQYLKEQGSPQWQDGHEPHEAVIREDIRKKASYVLTLGGEIVGTAALIAGKDPVYEAIEGEWRGEGPYVSLHHVAVSQKHRGIGLGKNLLTSAIKKAQALGYEDIRIDTYPANQPMLALIEKCGFTYCGMIHFPFEHGERKAFQLFQSLA